MLCIHHPKGAGPPAKSVFNHPNPYTAVSLTLLKIRKHLPSSSQLCAIALAQLCLSLLSLTLRLFHAFLLGPRFPGPARQSPEHLNICHRASLSFLSSPSLLLLVCLWIFLVLHAVHCTSNRGQAPCLLSFYYPKVQTSCAPPLLGSLDISPKLSLHSQALELPIIPDFPRLRMEISL